jgi:hypothetical protein
MSNLIVSSSSTATIPLFTVTTTVIRQFDVIFATSTALLGQFGAALGYGFGFVAGFLGVITTLLLCIAIILLVYVKRKK